MSERANLPESWATASLESLGVEVRGSVKPDARKNYELYSVPAYESRQPEVVEGSTIGSAKRPVQPGDVLICKINPRINRVWVVGEPATGLEQIASTEYLALRLKEQDREILSRYVAWYLRSPRFRDWIKVNVEGATGSHTRAKSPAVLRQLVPVAPLAEQERIVAAIEEQFSRLDAGVESLERARRNLRRMRDAVIQSAVEGALVAPMLDDELPEIRIKRLLEERRARWSSASKPYREPATPVNQETVRAPDHWALASLEQITDPIRVICYGILMPKENVKDGVLYVKVKDMRHGRIDLAGLHRTTPEIASKYARASLTSGDVLLSIRGTYGRVAVVPPELEGANITQDTARVALHPEIDRRFLVLYLQSRTAVSYFNRVARGVAVKGVNIGDLRCMPVPLPPPAEQERIVVEAERVLSVIEDIEMEVARNLRRSERLRRSVLAQAFHGTLVAQDDADEPASTLLERIGLTPQTTRTQTRRRSPSRRREP